MKKRIEVILIFDIGKTNKKFFVFDQKFAQIQQGQVKISEIIDDDGDPSDDLGAIESWIWTTINQVLHTEAYELTGINFSTYGASLVHLNRHGQKTASFYNYTKSFPFPLFEDFSLKYGSSGTQSLETGSPGVGFINSGFQLYWLKYHKPETYRHIQSSLHLPQYLSYMLTGIPVSDYTSVGCHTGLWNYATGHYDNWVLSERIDRKLAPLVSTYTSINCDVLGKNMKVGTGIHDSSAALLPYLASMDEPFILISTGTWSVTLNPFCEDPLTAQDLANGCLYYMRTDGHQVMAHRLFLGYELEYQVQKLAKRYDITPKKIQKIPYDRKVDHLIREQKYRYFQLEHLGDTQAAVRSMPDNLSIKKAYHHLVAELVEIQIKAVKSVIKKTKIKKIIMDGGFIHNEIFVQMLANRLPGLAIYTSMAPAGSALGAAITLNPESWSKKLWKKNYQLRRIK